MIIKRLAEGIKNQDWFVVMIEVLIVVVGIFIGLQVDDWNENAKLKVEINESLQSVKDDLQGDLVRLDQIIAFQKEKFEKTKQAIAILGAHERDDETLNSLIFATASDNFTYFPNMAAYQSMKETGKLDVISDRKIRLNLAKLFERVMMRQDLNAAYYDELVYTHARTSLAPNWSFTQKRPIREGRETLEIIENGLMLILDTNKFYLNQLKNDVRPSMVEAIEQISAYQLQQ